MTVLTERGGGGAAQGPRPPEVRPEPVERARGRARALSWDRLAFVLLICGAAFALLGVYRLVVI